MISNWNSNWITLKVWSQTMRHNEYFPHFNRISSPYTWANALFWILSMFITRLNTFFAINLSSIGLFPAKCIIEKDIHRSKDFWIEFVRLITAGCNQTRNVERKKNEYLCWQIEISETMDAVAMKPDIMHRINDFNIIKTSIDCRAMVCQM